MENSATCQHEKFTPSKQTTSALVTTLKCTATLIADLLQEGCAYVLTAQFETDPLERQFSKYCQMSGGRLLVRLREATNNERILALKSLLKESISFWQEIIRPNSSKDLALLHFNQNLENISSEIESCCLDQKSTKIAVVVSESSFLSSDFSRLGVATADNLHFFYNIAFVLR